MLAINLYPTSPLAAQEPLSTQHPSYNVPVSIPQAPALGNTSWGLSLDPTGISEALSSISLTQWGIIAAIAGGSAILTRGLNTDHEGSWPGVAMTQAQTSAFETLEYQGDWGLDAMKASTFYALGATGKGVTVSMSDSGIHTTHEEFTGVTITGMEAPTTTGTWAGGRTANGALDDGGATFGGHGTHVAATILGRKGTGGTMHGVAYEADGIYVLEAGCTQATNPRCTGVYFWTDSTATTTVLDDALVNARAAGSRVHNNSWGGSYLAYGQPMNSLSVNNRAEWMAALGPAGTEEFNGHVAAANAGMVQVWSSGNDGAKQVGLRAAGALFVTEFKDLWIAVGNIGNDLEESYMMNRCGNAWESCVVAPGELINSASNLGNTVYDTMSGTSMAAPHVTGAIAALMSRFPGLSSKEIVQRLLGTATYVGLKEYGTRKLATDMTLDERRKIFGRGLVQLVAAGKPLGGLSIVTGNSVKSLATPIHLSNISLGTAFGDGLQKNLHGRQMAVFDNLHRATFWIDVNQFVQSQPSSFSLSEGLATLAPQIRQQALPISNWGTLQMTSLTNATSTSPSNNTIFQNVQSLSLTTQFHSMPMEIRYDTIRALSGLGLTTFNNYASLLPNETILIPYAAFARNGLNLSLSANGPGSSRLTFATAYGKGTDRQESSLLTVAALHSAPSPTLNLATHVGLLLEPNTFLGSQPQGAFQLAPNSPTYFWGNAVSYQLYDRYFVEAANSWGVSRPQTMSGSLITNLSPIVSNAFSLGLTGPVDWMENDHWGMRISQPLRVVQGSGTLTLAQQRNQAGTIFSQNLPIDLRPLGQQLDLEAFYEGSAPRWGKVRISGLLRRHPGHRANLPAEGRIGIHYQQTF